MRVSNVPNSTIKLMIFPFSLKGAARIWLKKEPPRSILTWDDLVSKFIDQFFPPSKTTNLRNEITRFQQRFDESFSEEGDEFNDLLRACPHHGFSELHQLDTFYNALNVNDQDSLNSATGRYFLDKMPADCLKIIESKSKVRQTRAKAVVAKVSSNSSSSAISADVAELKDMVRALLLDKKNQYSAQTSSPTPALIKAVEPNFVTCGDNHAYQNCPETSGNVYQDNNQVYVSQAATANYGQGNTDFHPQMVANQIRPPGFPPIQNTQNNFNRGNNFNQNRGGNFNQSNFNQSQLNRPQVNQPLAYQAPAYQAPASQTQGSGTLPGNTVTNPKEDLKGITTRSGVAYQGPTTPTPSQVAKQGTEVTKDQVQTSNLQSTTPVQPTVTQSEPKTPVSEPVVAPVSAPMPNFKPLITYPLRRDNEKRRDQANEQIEKLYEIFKEMRLSLLELTPTCMTLELADRTECKPVGIAKDVKVKVGMFHFPAYFVVVDFNPDPRVPLILGRCFLKTSRALINVHKGELTLRIGNETITYNMDQTSRYSANYDQMTANKIDVTDEACEKYSQEVLGFSDVTASGSPTPSNDPIVSTTSPALTLFGDSDFLLFEEADAFLGLEDDPDSPELDPSYYDLEGDILSLEVILNSNPSPPLPNHEQSVPSFKEELKACEAKTIKSSINEPPEVELKDLPPILNMHFWKATTSCLCEDTKLCLNWEKSHFMVKEGIVIGHKFSKNRIEVDKAKIDVIAKLPYPTTVKGVRSFLDHASFYRRFIQDFSKISRPMTHLLEKDTPFVFSKDCIQAFQTLKKKLTETPILIAPNSDLPFELMYDASDFAICAVLGKRHEKHFRPIHYASKTMIDAESNYTTTEKEMLAVVYAFEKFRSYLIMNKCIVHTDHSALKYLFAKKDAKARLLR
nr:reverse transcriptase domain-containing protein [Tanacetum cinerariifolium]